MVDVETPIIKELGNALRDLGKGDVSLEGVPYGSDMRHFVHEGGMPAVLFGPGDVRRAHGVDESVAVEDLEVVAKTLALTALRFCGYGNERVI
jgi:acetylornithine deacetylase